MTSPTLPLGPLRRVLVRLRQAESLTRDELAARAGVTDRHLTRLLSGTTISLFSADRIACNLGLHPILIWPAEWPRVADDALVEVGGAA